VAALRRPAVTADEPELSVMPGTMTFMARDLALPDNYGLVLEQLKRPCAAPDFELTER
jgi:hypothetical protein